ncbi:NADH-quinone oxidoreductase subunit F [Candidatus Bipolaricaulota bacterium]|nr:NADH-quinone oxidoreductase subunit F [Candidatus Bipolaricaulota bacterium]
MVNPAYLLAVPLGLAFIIPLLKLISERLPKFIPPLGLLFNLIVSALLLPEVSNEPIVVNIGGFSPPFSINLVAGPVGVILSAFIGMIGFLVAIYSLDYIREGAEEKYYTLFLLFLTGATGVVLTGDIFNLFVFFEILCISSYSLVAYLGDKSGVEASVKYLIQGTVGSSFLLLGIGLLYGQFGTLNMADIASQIQATGSASVFFPLVLMVTGLGVEGAIFPLNGWLPDAHSSAPSSISAVLSGIAIGIGIYSIARVVFTIFGARPVFQLLAVIGLLTVLVGELSAFSQDDVKRLLAYSSIGQMGLIAFGLGIATTEGVTGGLFQLFSHGLAKALLFLAVGYMIYRSGSMKISSLKGMSKVTPVASLGFAVGAFSLVGLPPFMGFPSKFMVIRAALAKEELLFVVLVAFVLLGTVIEGSYFLRIVQVLYFKKEEPDSEVKHQRAPVSALIPICLLMVLIVVIGIYPGLITNFLNSAASEFLNRTGYIASVMG